MYNMYDVYINRLLYFYFYLAEFHILISFNTKFDFFYCSCCWKATLFKEISDNPLKNAPFLEFSVPD